MTLNRRELLTTGVGVAAVAALGGGTAAEAATALPPPQDSGIDHIVVVMMENRSFDHYLGWLPGADGHQAGLSYLDRDGRVHHTTHLQTYTGCGHPDPDHSYEGGRVQLDGGRCDGWLWSGDNDTFAIGYYTDADLDFYRHAARDWTVCDRYFSAVMAETYPNRFFAHSAQTDRIHNSTTLATMPTIWDRLAAAGVSAAYYFSDVPFLALWGTKYLGICRTFGQFVADAKGGTLPAVSFVDPRFLAEEQGLSNDDHPHSDIRAGQYFLNSVYEAVTASPNWARTALVINYDEWGGFFDHVPPAVAPDPRPDLDTGLRGFRVPCLVISPRSRRGTVRHATYDHTSVLKMIGWRFGLPPLTVRDAAARNLAETLDFTTAPNLSAPRYAVPPLTTPGCLAPTSTSADHTHAGDGWSDLHRHATALGFIDPPRGG
jgi:phospholipase C